MKIHLVMPMAGAGSRFYQNGFHVPKPLIEIHGKPFLYWSTMSVMQYMELEDLTFVVLNRHIRENQIDKVIEGYFPDAKIINIPEILPGPVFTALKGVKAISDCLPVVFNDCDHMFRCSRLSRLFQEQTDLEDGYLLTFESQEPQFSYVRYHDDGRVSGTLEKKVVSNHAICGAYVFKDADTFRTASQEYIRNCPYQEYFMSGIYNVMCDQGKTVKDLLLDYHVEFGTPEEYEKAQTSGYFEEFERK